MSDEELNPLAYQFKESELEGDGCPICKGARELRNLDSPTGFEDCICKLLREWRDIQGPLMKGVPSLEKEPFLAPYYGKDLFIKGGKPSVDDQTSKLKALAQVKAILGMEFLKVLRYRRGLLKEKPLYPKWSYLTSFELLNLRFDKGDLEVTRRRDRFFRKEPWVFLELGETCEKNKMYHDLIPNFGRTRRSFNLSTWVFTVRDRSWLLERYGKETLTWLDSMPSNS